jgi:hypothetical protein
MCPKRLFNNFVVGVNGMSFNKSLAKDVDMILTPTIGLLRALKGALLIWQQIDIEGESRQITSKDSSNSSIHSLLIIETSSFVVFLRKASLEGSRISSLDDDFLGF